MPLFNVEVKGDIYPAVDPKNIHSSTCGDGGVDIKDIEEAADIATGKKTPNQCQQNKANVPTVGCSECYQVSCGTDHNCSQKFICPSGSGSCAAPSSKSIDVCDITTIIQRALKSDGCISSNPY